MPLGLGLKQLFGEQPGYLWVTSWDLATTTASYAVIDAASLATLRTLALPAPYNRAYGFCSDGTYVWAVVAAFSAGVPSDLAVLQYTRDGRTLVSTTSIASMFPPSAGHTWYLNGQQPLWDGAHTVYITGMGYMDSILGERISPIVAFDTGTLGFTTFAAGSVGDRPLIGGAGDLDTVDNLICTPNYSQLYLTTPGAAGATRSNFTAIAGYGQPGGQSYTLVSAYETRTGLIWTAGTGPGSPYYFKIESVDPNTLAHAVYTPPNDSQMPLQTAGGLPYEPRMKYNARDGFIYVTYPAATSGRNTSRVDMLDPATGVSTTLGLSAFIAPPFPIPTSYTSLYLDMANTTLWLSAGGYVYRVGLTAGYGYVYGPVTLSPADGYTAQVLYVFDLNPT